MATKDLPPDVLPGDCEYPKYNPAAKRLPDDTPMSLTFYKTERLGWVLTTLHISNPSRSQRGRGVDAARTYGIGVSDSKVYTVGRGPHVTAEVTVYLTADNIGRLTRYLELYRKGLADASSIRDRISSRRAQGQLYRSEGRSSWRW